MKKTIKTAKSASRKPAPKKTDQKKPAGKKTLPRLISAGEPAPYRIENAKGASPFIVVCDHASNRIPASLGTMGLSKKDRQRHIAWDPGTDDIGRYLAKKLDATYVSSTWSRLVVDVNRGPDSPECIRAESDGTRIAVNETLGKAEKKQRIDEIFKPYHKALDKEIRRIARTRGRPVVLSIHSFTPEMGGQKRPWHIGVLWNKEEGIARKLIRNLRRNNPGMVVGANEPYSLRHKNYSKNTIGTHAEDNGYPYVIVEFRQDLVSTKLKAATWAALFLESLQPVLDELCPPSARKKPVLRKKKPVKKPARRRARK